MGIGPGSGFAGLGQGLESGMDWAQQRQMRQAQIAQQRAKADTDTGEAYTQRAAAQKYNDMNGLGQIPQFSVQDPVIAAFKGAYNRIRGSFGHAPATPSAQGPAGPTVNPQSQPSPAQSAPGPESSNSAAGGQLGAGSSQVVGQSPADDSWKAEKYSPAELAAGADGGQLRTQLGRPTGVTPPTGIKPRPQKRPRNTEAQPSLPGGTDQGGPMFDDGGQAQPTAAQAFRAAKPLPNPAYGTKQVNLGDGDVTVSADPDAEERAATAAQSLAQTDKDNSARRAAGKGIPPRQYGKGKNPGPPKLADGGDTDQQYFGQNSPAERIIQAEKEGWKGTGRDVAKTLAGRSAPTGERGQIPPAGAQPNAPASSDPASSSDAVTPDPTLGPTRASAVPGDTQTQIARYGAQQQQALKDAGQQVNGTGTPQATPAAPPAQGAGRPTPGGPAKAQAPVIDFSQVRIDHRDIPSVSATDWDTLKKYQVSNMVMHGIGPAQAQILADDQVSDYQHRQFMQMMQQGIALDRQGDKQGAMSALRTAYQYFPNGHDVTFGLDPKTNNLVGVTHDEKTGAVSGYHMLDQGNLNALLATYQDPKEFQRQQVGAQEMALRKEEFNKIRVPGAAAQRAEQYGRAAYFNARNPTAENVATIRANASAANRLSPQTEGIYRDTIEKQIFDPGDQGEALQTAAEAERQFGSSPNTAREIAGRLMQVYKYPPGPQREQARQAAGLPRPSGQGSGDPNRDYQALYGGGGGEDYTQPTYNGIRARP